MNKTNQKRWVSLLLAVALLFTSFLGLGGMTVRAAESAEVYYVSFPRAGDEYLDYSGTWGHGDLQFMNGWSSSATVYTMVRAMGSYEGNICYCIEPGVPLSAGDILTQLGEDFWENYPSDYNNTIEPYEIKLFIGRIMQYGYTGTISTEWRSQNEGGSLLAYAEATQLLIWETVVGERDSDFRHVDTGGYDAVLDQISTAHPLYDKIISYYNSIVSSVQAHSVLPSFMQKTTGKAESIELTWNGTNYSATLTDTNNVLSNYIFSGDGLTFSVSGNQLTITADTAPTGTVTITAEKVNSQRRGTIIWTDGYYLPGNSTLQDVVTYAESVSDPVVGYLKAEVSYGSAKIVKTSEDGKVSGVSFTIFGNEVNETVITDANGEILIENLTPGTYTVTELTEDKYETQESQTVTVIGGQTSTVTFNNTLKRGSLKVTKTAEDGLTEGILFHLYGTSLSGSTVDEYAVTDASGVANFEDVLIGSGYTLEEVNTPNRYVVPDSQTVSVAWNTVTNATVENILKKFTVTVTKTDSETGSAQGDASLAGAVYGIYQGGVLVDTYTTDANGQFTTTAYSCGDDWTIQEITPSEGYLLDDTVYTVGAEAKNYTVEYNPLSIGVTEDVIKGSISIIKHTDNGSTQIETPEEGAVFEIYLKSAGSYDAANETERDILICDEYGYAESKELPYGVYTVHQVSGWDGSDLMRDFDVYISSDGEIYRYLINNSAFESYVKIVKTDAETGNTIPYAGAGFQIYDPNGDLVTMTYTYPTVTTIDTFYTDNSGCLITPQSLPYGTGYSIVEVQAPYGYVLDSTPVYFNITEDKSTEENGVTVVTVTKTNSPQMGTITVEKTGEVFYSVTETDGVYQPIYEVQSLSSAVYEIRAAEDIVTPDGTLRYSKGELVDTVSTGSDGTATSGELYLGKYTVTEISAPYGMVLCDESHTVELTYAGQDVSVTETATSFYNERQKVEISLSKVMETDSTFGIGSNGEILSVQFGLYVAEELISVSGASIPANSLLEIISCDENGNTTFTTDLPIGCYYIEEIATDEYYILSDEKYYVVFDYVGQDTAVVEIAVNNSEAIQNKLIYGSVHGLKIDRETEEPICGAVFGLFSADTEDFTEDTALLIATSDENGVFIFENIPYGNYLVKELQPADGYLSNDEVYTITIAEDGEVIEVTAVNDRIPEIGTTATVDGEKEICATEVFTLTDTVSYQHLIPGKEYLLQGVLMDKSTGEPLLINGEGITAETIFTPETPSGEVEVVFTFDSKYIKEATEIVAFESLYSDGTQLAVHADIDDEGQTVTVKVPEIKTTATVNGEKEITTNTTVTVVDTVSYHNLTPNKEYTITGVLMNKATGEAFMVTGSQITAEVTFTPEESDGTVEVTFQFDASGITTQTKLVVFETLYRDDVEIAAHADIEDTEQTVTITPPSTESPKTGVSNLGFWLGLGGVTIGGIAGILYLKHKKDDSDG